ncbi:class Ib ribonucleoside-diphosphate reductase assembly flavoprotein NrdI [Subtercola sp. YIM 133946]|uniref:class Ib ribonucleoside-diphosphate reductase assembly flavoprotein NrdI n=1 Tax=Subtercola sp. YIM 133946 TaxID=3118909 RepID=UPI002F953839
MVTDLVYFSSVSNNTHRFVEKLGRQAKRIPVNAYKNGAREKPLVVNDPYVLVLPTYGGGTNGGAVPKQVIHFLNDTHNRSLIRGVIAAGNTNFGEAYCLAGDIVSKKCDVATLYRFEVFGTPDDVEAVTTGLDEFWKAH